jgi:hypothetical protein
VRFSRPLSFVASSQKGKSTMTPERKALAEAITRHAFALQKVKQTEELLQKANNRLCILYGESTELSEYDAEIEAKRTEGFKMALVNDEPILHQEPEGYALVRLKKERNASEIQGTRDGITALEEELEFVKREAEETDYQVELAREAVFCADAEQLAQKFFARLNDLRQMSHNLRFMAARQVTLRRPERDSSTPQMFYAGSERSRSIRMSRDVINACQENIMGNSDLHGNLKVRDRVAQEVNAYWAALRTDADAKLSEETKENLFPSGVRSDVSADASLESAE